MNEEPIVRDVETPQAAAPTVEQRLDPMPQYAARLRGNFASARGGRARSYCAETAWVWERARFVCARNE